MSIEWVTRTIIECNYCGETDELPLEADDLAHARRIAKTMGWYHNGDDHCPECAPKVRKLDADAKRKEPKT